MVTFSWYEKYDGLFDYTEQDIANGALLSESIANASGSVLIGAATDSAGCLGGRVGQAVKGYDMVSNAVGVAQGTGNIIENGPNAGNVLQVIGSGAGLAAGGLSKCFTEGTQIVVGAEYDESDVFVQYVTVNIEDVEVGDWVYSYDTITGETTQRQVTDVFVRESDHINYLTIADEKGNIQVIETTDGHPFWVVTDEPDLDRAASDYSDGMYHGPLEITAKGYWIEAKDLREGDVFLGANGELSTLLAAERVVFGESIRVYNFSIDEDHSYFVIAQADEFGQTCVLVHNADDTYNIARRFMGRQEYKNVKKNGLNFDPDKGKGIPAATTNIDPVDPDAIKDILGAEIADYFIDFDVSEIKTLATHTKFGNIEIRILESVPPSKIVAHGRVGSGYPGN